MALLDVSSLCMCQRFLSISLLNTQLLPVLNVWVNHFNSKRLELTMCYHSDIFSYLNAGLSLKYRKSKTSIERATLLTSPISLYMRIFVATVEPLNCLLIVNTWRDLVCFILSTSFVHFWSWNTYFTVEKQHPYYIWVKYLAFH